jgi:hypothetical protein
MVLTLQNDGKDKELILNLQQFGEDFCFRLGF